MSKPKGKEFFSQRDILWYLVFIGFAVNYMIRINLNIAIVSMVKSRTKSGINPDSECLRNISILSPAEPKSTLTTFGPYEVLTQNSSDGHNFTDSLTTQKSIPDVEHTKAVFTADDDTFPWNEHEQGRVLGAFFWLHWVTQIPGGILAAKYGTKLIFGLSNFIGILCCFLIPVSCYLGVHYVIILRIFQGIICGFAWPSMHNMTAQWIPPNERSKFVTAYLGSSVGAAITFPMCGYIIHWLGWKWVFYVSGVIGCVWYAGWYFLVYDSPNTHPRITETEKLYITDSLGKSVSDEKKPIPWGALLTSKYLYLNVMAQWVGLFGLFTLITHGPMYFKMIHGWDIRATGILSGMPHLVRVIWAFAVSMSADYLLRSNKMSRTNVRKLATFFCTTVQGLCMLGIAFSGCDKVMAVLFFTLATGVNGAVSSGPLASLVDLSPNYASVMLGFCNTGGAVSGFITPLLVVYFTYQNQSVAQWQKVFLSTSLPLIIPGIIYVIFSKSELQPWNSPPDKVSNKEAELKLLEPEKKEKDKENV